MSDFLSSPPKPDRATVIAVVVGVVCLLSSGLLLNFMGLNATEGWPAAVCYLAFFGPLATIIAFNRRKRVGKNLWQHNWKESWRRFAGLSPSEKAGAAIGTVLVGLFGFGMVFFPDAPYRPCSVALGYCGKSGMPHGAAQYHAFMMWQNAMITIWPIGVAAAFITQYIGKKRSTTSK